MENPITPNVCWSNVLKSPAPPKPSNPIPGAAISGEFAGICKSTKGIAVAVVDANAIIDGGDKLSQCAEKFVSVSEVIDEIRDPVSRHRLAVLPFSVQTMEPSPESINKVMKFARATGDLQTLSAVDIKLIALTYTLEAQIYGTEHLRACPPPIETVDAKRVSEKELPGWGSNVPDLEEWEALANQAEQKPSGVSRILPLKDLNLNVVSDAGSEQQEEAAKDNSKGFRRYPPKKTEINIEGKKMVADGIDASNGEFDGDEGDWMPAVSRSTHRRYLRRKARREFYNTLSEKDGVSEKNETVEDDNVEGENALVDGKNDEESLSTILEEMRLDEDSLKQLQEEDGCAIGDDLDAIVEGLDGIDLSSEINGSVEASNVGDDDSSEQSWSLRSLSESSVACITGDFAMQNVLLQMGLRLVAPGGMQIRQLQRWVLRCHACYTVTAEIGKIFCPKCGNGGTLRKVAVTVSENGITLAARRTRFTLRGTKFSLPLPQGGRDAIAKNLILREDQLPRKFLHPMTKKSKKEDDDICPDLFSIHQSDKRPTFQPPIKKSLAAFGGRRNPNDNHYTRSKRK